MADLVPAVEPPNQPGVRRRRALATRQRMLGAAYDLFCQQGYLATTMAAIAERAGVAVQTLHFTFHTKAQLLIELLEVYAAGPDHPTPVMARPWMEELLNTPDPRRQLALTIEHGTEIYVRLAPLAGAVQAAATVEPEVAAAWSEVGRNRRAGMGRMVERLAKKGGLAPGLSIERATDLLYVLQSHETFLGLTAGCNWTVPEYKAWQYENLCRVLMDDRSPAARRRAARGLTFEALLAPAGTR